MQLPANPLKRALRERRRQIGLWSMLASPIATEVIAGSGFDFIVLDMEHAPNELPGIREQLAAMQTGSAAPVVRPPWNDTVAFKRLLDLGAQNFVVPMVQSADEARRAVAATRYPPGGVRGVAVANRANRFGRITDYLQRANDEICVHVQLETRTALANLEAIAAVDGVDGLFIGPSDLAADLGQLGNGAHPEVRRAIDDAIARICATGKAAGILTPVEADARHWLDLGATFVAVGSDLGVLARQTEALAKKFIPHREGPP
jgi:4-hydroxy-2-oxoheptanedioate aldolase